ncbi:MAG: hypothetical protein H0W96_03885 [Solirubrobacterales bacterium]|nr:hypothetical protein [Solirubrobacterales bacterium]
MPRRRGLSAACVVIAVCVWASIASAQDSADVPRAFVELVSGPVLSGNSAVVQVRATNATQVRGSLLSGTSEIAAAVVAVTSGRRVEAELTLALDDASRQTLASVGVVRVRLVLEALADGAQPGTLSRATTLVRRPQLDFRRTGKERSGGFGGQIVRGTNAGDLLRGDSGNDELFGRAGTDKLLGGTGNDRLHGGLGRDLLDGDDGDDVLLGGPGDDQLVEARFGLDTLDGGDGNDWIDGARGVDRLRGGSGDDVLVGGPAHDFFDCGPGDDIALLNLQSERPDTRNCETILDEPDFVIVPCRDGGSDGPETLLGTDGPDTCEGGAGNDDVEGAGGDDRLFGGPGNDRIFGRFGDDLLVGNGGDDEIEGGRGEDMIQGGFGDDRLNGGFGRDRIDGGPGDDEIIARGGSSDRINCGPGTDVAYVDSSDRTSRCESVRRPR